MNVFRGSSENFVFCNDVLILCTRIAKTKGQESNGQDQIDWIKFYDLKLLLGYLPLCIFISPALGPGILYRLNKFLINE